MTKKLNPMKNHKSPQEVWNFMCKLDFPSHVFWEGNYSLYKLSLLVYILNVRTLHVTPEERGVPQLTNPKLVKLLRFFTQSNIDWYFSFTRVELSITEHVPIIEHFPIFFSFLNQIEWFLCHWRHKLEGYTCYFTVRSKGTTEKTQEEDKW
jgi:hypothetical protein